mmetsp:Transcript_110762/g.313379  ORF Transcript_110762/g.313379 Transcript_110762/m.313379 type:complete len:245 (-) Transcript_110762:224-958(-)
MFASAARAASCRAFSPGCRSAPAVSASTAPAASAVRAAATLPVMCIRAWLARHCRRPDAAWPRIASTTTCARSASRCWGTEGVLAMTWHVVSCARRSSGWCRASAMACPTSHGISHSYQPPWPSAGSPRVRDMNSDSSLASRFSCRTLSRLPRSCDSSARRTQPWPAMCLPVPGPSVTRWFTALATVSPVTVAEPPGQATRRCSAATSRRLDGRLAGGMSMASTLRWNSCFGSWMASVTQSRLP